MDFEKGFIAKCVNFTKVLQAAILPISFGQKLTNTDCNHRTAAQKALKNFKSCL